MHLGLSCPWLHVRAEASTRILVSGKIISHVQCLLKRSEGQVGVQWWDGAALHGGTLDRHASITAL